MDDRGREVEELPREDGGRGGRETCEGLVGGGPTDRGVMQCNVSTNLSVRPTRLLISYVQLLAAAVSAPSARLSMPLPPTKTTLEAIAEAATSGTMRGD